MKKIALLSLVAAFAILALSSFIRLTNGNNSPNRLASNKDFKNWLTAATSLKTIIEKTNIKTAFSGFLKRTNTPLQNEKLAKALGYKNSEELKSNYVQMNSYVISFIKANPELATKKAQNIFNEALRENLQDEPPACFDIWSLAVWNCNSRYPSGDLDWVMCMDRAYLAYIDCSNQPIE